MTFWDAVRDLDTSHAIFFFVALTIASILTACATPPPTTPPEIVFRDHPQLNIESVAEIGETLLFKSKLYVFDGLPSTWRSFSTERP